MGVVGTDEEVVGYVFSCNNSTQRPCCELQLFGSPARELGQMQRCIRMDSQLFLFNFEASVLLGPFVAISEPESNIVPDAFGAGKFTAQVRASALEGCVHQIDLQQRLFAGPRSAKQVGELRFLLDD